MILLRQELGDELRQRRMRQGRTLRQVSAAARVSLGYLSEVERGQKEASSELLAAICTALDVRLSDLLDGAAARVRHLEPAPSPAAPVRSAESAPAAEATASTGRTPALTVAHPVDRPDRAPTRRRTGGDFAAA